MIRFWATKFISHTFRIVKALQTDLCHLITSTITGIIMLLQIGKGLNNNYGAVGAKAPGSLPHPGLIFDKLDCYHGIWERQNEKRGHVLLEFH